MVTAVAAKLRQLQPGAAAPVLPAGPGLVELVGLAGVGKTTLTTALVAQQPQRFSRQLALTRTTMARHLLEHSKTFLPAYLRAWPRTSWFTQTELRAMVYLSAWPAALAQQNATTIQLMDQGPIYRLAYLQEFGSPLTRSAAFAHWKSAQIKQWRQLLDVVVFLDAPDTVLQQRIDQRSKQHAVKAGTAAESMNFFRRYKSAYHDILARMATGAETAGGPLILRIDTSQAPVNVIVAQVMATLPQVRP